MAITINHQTNDISTTGAPLTIGGAPISGGAAGDVDGGASSTIYTAAQTIEGGDANG